MNNYLDLSILEINELLKNKTIKPIDLVEEFIFKIKESNINAFITIDIEGARRDALELECKEVDNILFGIPIAIKDNIVTKNLKTSAGSLMLDNFIPIYDATVVEKLRAKNMIIIGKTNMDEFGIGETGGTSYYGETLNPWDKSRVSGGSSSGSAAAISAGLVPLSLGTDTGGSIRVPSSFCGVVGMKPSYGRVSRYGLIPLAPSFDQIGPISRNVYENAMLLEIISGFDNKDCTSSSNNNLIFTDLKIDIKSKRVAIPTYYFECDIDSEVRASFELVINKLEEKGVSIEYIDIPYIENTISLYKIIASSEISSSLSCYDGIRYGYTTKNYSNIEDLYKNTRTEGFGQGVKQRIVNGTYILSGKNSKYYYKSLSIRKIMIENVKKIFDEYDYILTPTTSTVAFHKYMAKEYIKNEANETFGAFANLTGLPALSLPIGNNSENMPIGIQIMADYFKEADIYKIAHLIESELNINLKTRRDE